MTYRFEPPSVELQRKNGLILLFFLGALFFVSSVPLMWWNENSYVARHQTLEEGLSRAVSVSSDRVDPTHNNALIHISGTAQADDILQDSIFGVEENALKMRRVVEMYQWRETSRYEGKDRISGSVGRTVYSYDKVWSPRLISSSNFREARDHQNPSSMPFKSQSFRASDVGIGAFTLSRHFDKHMGERYQYPLSQRNLDAGDPILTEYFKLNGNQFFYGDPQNPQIGALRVYYIVTPAQDVSVIGQQDGGRIEPFQTETGKIALLQNGYVDAESMFAISKNQGNSLTWGVRGVAFFLLVFGGVAMLLSLGITQYPLPVIDRPITSRAVVMSVMPTSAFGLAIIAFAWLSFRPFTSIVLLAIAGGLLLLGARLILRELQLGVATTTQPVAPRRRGDFPMRRKTDWALDD